jgi:GntR family transcriptional regulator
VIYLKLQPASPIPMYLQIVEQVRRGVAGGQLKPDDELPSVRALASRHLINPNTVARAYLELEREGLVAKRRGSGTYISPQAGGLSAERRTRIVAELLDKALRTAFEFGLPASKVRTLFEERLRHAKAELAAAKTEREA